MNPEQIMLVQSSWDDIEPVSSQIGEQFYLKFFELQPEAKQLFQKSPREQGELIMSMIASVVDMLDKPDRIEPLLRDLGHRHKEYGVAAEFFEPFKEALFWALEKVMGDGFSGQIKEAWEAVFSFISERLISSLK